MDKNKREDFFLFKISKGDLKKDEHKGLGKLFMSFVVVFVALDIGLLIYYQKTKTRMEEMMSHPYTNIIRSNIEESTAEHQHYAANAKQTIKTHHDSLRQLLDSLEFNTREVGHVNLAQLNGLEELKGTLNELAGDPRNSNLWSTAKLRFSVLSASMARLSDSIRPLKEFISYNNRLDNDLGQILQEVKANLDGFLGKLINFAAERSQDQHGLHTQMIDTIRHFNATYDGIVHDNRYVRLNNYYRARPISYDKNYVPFVVEFDNKYFGAKLTVESEFKLKLPRVYFCNLRAHLTSDGQFDVRFQYVDALHEDKILFESESIKGGKKEPASFDEYFTFDLSKAQHRLYLRVVSLGASTQLHIERLELACLSYRNFVE